MEDELIDSVRSFMRDRRTSSPRLPAWKLLQSLNIKDPRTVNGEYGWHRTGLSPSIVLTIWTEFVELDDSGRWCLREDLDWKHRRDGQERTQLQQERAQRRVKLLKDLWRTKEPFLALLQTNIVRKFELMNGATPEASFRTRDEQLWHVADLNERGEGAVVLVRGPAPVAQHRSRPVVVAATEKPEPEPALRNFAEEIGGAAAMGGGGEGEAHRELKEYVRSNPAVIGLMSAMPNGEAELRLPSGDSIDVSFDDGQSWVGVEVKASISSVVDITRGLFQCVKYKAVMEAVVVAEPRARATRVVLVLGGPLPQKLTALQILLGIEVIDCVAVQRANK